MAQNISFERPFSFVFKDPAWTRKVLMGGLYAFLTVVIIGVFLLLGYQKRLFLAQQQDPSAPLPEFDFGADIAAGLPVAAIAIGYIVLFAVACGIVSIVPCVGPILSMAVYLLMLVALPAGMMRFYATERIGAAFEFKEIIEFVRLNLVNMVLVAVIQFVAGLVGSLGMIACFVGVFFTGFYALLVTTAAMADAWRLAQTPGAGGQLPPSPVP